MDARPRDASALPARPDEASPDGLDADEGLPRWVKVSGAIAILVLVAFVVLHLTGSSPGGHGP